MNVFISYARRDYYDDSGRVISGTPVDRLRRTLESNNISYWIDEKINPGDPFAEYVVTAIQECDVFIFISSAHSNSSDWANAEIHIAKECNKRIVPFKIDTAPYHKSYKLYLSYLDYVDYVKNPDEALLKLVRMLKNKNSPVLLPDRVKLEQQGEDLKIGESKLSDKVFGIFSAHSLSVAVSRYLDIVSAMNDLTGNKHPALINVVQIYKQLKECTTADLQRIYLAELSISLQNSISQVERVDRLLLHLGLMLAFYYLNESAQLKMVQDEIRNSSMELTWWEKNGDSVKEYAYTIAGIAASVLMRTNVGIGMKYGYAGGKESSDKHRRNIKKTERYFNAMRDTIVSVHFL